MPGRAGGTPAAGLMRGDARLSSGAGAPRHRPNQLAPGTPTPARPRPGSCWNSASSKDSASSVFSSSSPCGTGTPQRAIPASMCRMTVSITSTRPFRLLSDEITSQGANGPLVNRSMSDTASSYCGRFSRLRQSSSVSFHALSGSSRRRSNRRSCSSSDMCIQSLITTIPSSANECSKSVISLIGAAPLHLGGEVLDPLDEHAPVPAAVEDGHAAPSRQRRPEPPQEVVPQLVGRRRGERGDVHVAGVERLDQPLDGAALAGGVPALEDDAHRRAEVAVVELTAIDQPQVQQAALRLSETLRLLVLGELQREVGVLQPWIGQPGSGPIGVVVLRGARCAVARPRGIHGRGNRRRGRRRDGRRDRACSRRLL